jgi:hypothetical protein
MSQEFDERARPRPQRKMEKGLGLYEILETSELPSSAEVRTHHTNRFLCVGE